MKIFVAAFVIVAAAALLLPTALLVGPMVEGRFFPVRTGQSIHDVSRTGQDLCWTWTSFKARDRISDNIDVFADIDGLPGAVSAPWERGTRMPWVSTMALPAGHWHDQHWCVTLPPYVRPDMPVRIRQLAWYPGWMGLWHTALVVPEIVDPAGAVIR